MDITLLLVEEIKSKVLEGVDRARTALFADPTVDYDALSNAILADFDDYFDFKIDMPNIYGELEIPKTVLSKKNKKKKSVRVCKINYPIVCTFRSPGVLEVIKGSSTADIEFDIERISVIQDLGESEVDEADFKSAVAAVRRFMDNSLTIKKDIKKIIEVSKVGLKQQIATLFVEHDKVAR